MLNGVYIVYDNSCKPNYDIENIIGDKSFAQIIYKRRTLKERYFEKLCSLYLINNIIEIDNLYSLEKIINIMEVIPENTKIAHLFSDNIVKHDEEFITVIQKSQYIKQTTLITSSNDNSAIFFNGTKEYIYFLKMCISCDDTKIPIKETKYETLKSDAFYNMNNLSNFLQYMTGGFDARFFNSLQGDEYTVTKTSTNKKKIKSEYTFYSLIPDDMKSWFVLPYNYVENENTASYTMERLHMTDIAIRWVHGAISPNEFRKLLKKIFYFLDSRKTKEISKLEYENILTKLFLEKVDERIEELKKHEMFPIINNYLQYSTKYANIDEVVSNYKVIYHKAMSKVKLKYVSAIGHGDLCFPNMLYNKDTMTLKLIDTKGALKEEEIWTNPYYDIAKLSHSICGKYDFFNTGLYDIRLNEDMMFELTVDYDNTEYVKIFKEFLTESGFSYNLTRVFESSLFLSMLPLHMDNHHKVFGFLLNAINIMEEVKNV